MISKTTAAALVAAGLTLTITQAQAEPRLSFINKYIERYAKVKPDGTIAGYKVSSLSSDSTSTATGGGKSVSSRVSSLRNRVGKK